MTSTPTAAAPAIVRVAQPGGRRLGDRARTWLAWAVAILTFVLLGAGSGLAGATPASAMPAGLRAAADGWYFRLSPIYAQAFVVVGALIVWRRPGNRVGWVACAIGALVGFEVFVGAYANYAAYGPHRLPGRGVAEWLTGWEWLVPLLLMVVVLPLVFPDGRLLSPRWRLLLPFLALSVTCVAVGSGTGVDALNYLGQAIDLATGGLAVASVVVRYRRAGMHERQQIAWFGFAVGLVAVVALAGTAVSFGVFHTNTVVFNPYFDVLIPVALTAIPVSIGVAVLRYRLYDIDVVLRRAIVYGALVVLITAVYIIVVVTVGTRINPSNADRAIPFVVAAVLAVAFQPLRSRLQRLANRLVYGRRATPYQVLSQFSKSVSELYELPQRMARVLAEGTEADRAEVWLHVNDELHRTATWPVTDVPMRPLRFAGQVPDIPDAAASVPVVHQGEVLGVLALRKRDPLTPVEVRLLGDVAHEAALALRNERLTAELTERLAELTASRQRIVAAQDIARRRLERDLHDGAQQQIVALKIKLDLARAMGQKDPARAMTMLEELSHEAGDALETLRELAHGIYPPILAESGVAAALRAHVRRLPLDVDVTAAGVERQPEALEAAVYFCCMEALQNMVKHAQATHATVALRQTGAELAFSVSDNGVGIDPERARAGSGMQNMRDRVAALGGDIEVCRGDGGGTVVRGRVPLAEPDAQDQVTSP
ncbi:MAG: GAF domain-containing sensor histidine kinase [Candidatus Dormibacteraeota bacterium]|nr:GAF domain-containing sensor histidine kinase [Candidatus Dormibacteraeota bacterium]MBV9524752.1 GAF domain-containing sensor histidine kinase [Candidatus Dormibacteraeota bacterium]